MNIQKMILNEFDYCDLSSSAAVTTEGFHEICCGRWCDDVSMHLQIK